MLKTSDGKSRLLRVIAPLNVLLIKGLGLTIDKTRIGDTGFVRCLPSGCVADVVMDDALLDQLKNGKTATFVIYLTPGRGRRPAAVARRLQGGIRQAAVMAVMALVAEGETPPPRPLPRRAVREEQALERRVKGRWTRRG